MEPSRVLGYTGLALIVVGFLGGMVPFWKSRARSPASIRRRVFWTGSVAGVALLSVSQLPDWRSSVFIVVAAALVLVLTAYRFTSHIKLGRRVYEYMRDPEAPDPPPALARADE